MPDFKVSYATATDSTITLASLASDTNLLIGRESTVIDNTTALNLNLLVSGKITTGTSPTASRIIEVWAIGSWDGSTWPNAFTGDGDASRTITSADIKANIGRLIAAMVINSTSDRTYHFGPTSVAAAFGGTLPPKLVLFVTHNTGTALNSVSGNHQIRLQPVYETVN